MDNKTISIPLPNLATQKEFVKIVKRLETDSTPDVKHRNPDPDYLRLLVAMVGESQRGLAKRLGIGERTFRDYLNKKHTSEMPYPVQFAIERLAVLYTTDETGQLNS